MKSPKIRLLLSFLFVLPFITSTLTAGKHAVVGKLSAETKNEGLSKRSKCCRLGKEVAKVGDMCSYTESRDSLKPDSSHYHVMKTSLWQKEDANPIKARKLQKCKRFKSYYEKCCRTEAANIEKDIRRLRKNLRRYLHDTETRRSNLIKETKTNEKNDGSSAVLIVRIQNPDLG